MLFIYFGYVNDKGDELIQTERGLQGKINKADLRRVEVRIYFKPTFVSIFQFPINNQPQRWSCFVSFGEREELRESEPWGNLPPASN